MTTPYYADDQGRIFHGDCLDVLATLPDSSIDAVCTDPPYNLSTSAKRDKKCLREVVSEILLPRDEHDDTERGEGVHLATPALRGADLRGEDWAVRVDAGVGVPEGAVHFEHPTVVQDEVGAGNEPAALATDGDLPLEGDSLSFEFGGDLILQSADGWDATFCNGTCRCFTEPSTGFIAVSVVVPRLAGGNRSGVRLVVEGRDANVGVRHDAGRQAEGPTGVHAGRGAEDRAVLRLDLRGGTGELDLTDRTLDNLTPFQLARAEGVGAGAGAGRLSPVAQPYRVRVVERPNVDGVQHPTVKPVDLMRWCIRLVTPAGGTVLDPFGGSGTTAEACIAEGMQYTLIEREAEYLPLILHRAQTAHPTLFGGGAA